MHRLTKILCLGFLLVAMKPAWAQSQSTQVLATPPEVSSAHIKIISSNNPQTPAASNGAVGTNNLKRVIPTQSSEPSIVRLPLTSTQNTARILINSTVRNTPENEIDQFMETNEKYGGILRTNYVQEELATDPPLGGSSSKMTAEQILQNYRSEQNRLARNVPSPRAVPISLGYQDPVDSQEEILGAEKPAKAIGLSPSRDLPRELVLPNENDEMNFAIPLLQDETRIPPPSAAAPGDLKSRNRTQSTSPQQLTRQPQAAQQPTSAYLSINSATPEKQHMPFSSDQIDLLMTDSPPNEIENVQQSSGTSQTNTAHFQDYSQTQVPRPTQANMGDNAYQNVVADESWQSNARGYRRPGADFDFQSSNANPCCNNMFYVTLFGGNSTTENIDTSVSTLSNNNFGPTPFNRLHFKDGAVVGGALGIYHGQNLRADYEFAYRTNSAASIESILSAASTGPETPIDGGLNVYTGMSNIYWDFQSAKILWFTPYVGGGLGFALFDSDLNNFGKNLVSANYDSDSNFAYQWIAGGNRALTKNIDAFLEYRALTANNVDFRFDTSAISGGPHTEVPSRFDYVSKNILFGLRVRF